MPRWNMSASGELIGFVELGGEGWPTSSDPSAVYSELAEPNSPPAFSAIPVPESAGQVAFVALGTYTPRMRVGQCLSTATTKWNLCCVNKPNLDRFNDPLNALVSCLLALQAQWRPRHRLQTFPANIFVTV